MQRIGRKKNEENNGKDIAFYYVWIYNAYIEKFVSSMLGECSMSEVSQVAATIG